MTVAELLEILKTYDQNLNVLLATDPLSSNGYVELNADNIKKITYLENYYDEEYFGGRHQEINKLSYIEEVVLETDFSFVTKNGTYKKLKGLTFNTNY